MSDRIALGMACLTFSLQLKIGELDDMTLGELRERAERLPVDDPLFLAITEAAVQAEIAQTPVRLAAIGAQLHDRLAAEFLPVVPGLDRVDIYG